MNLNEEKYSRFALCREMLETPDVIKKFNVSSLTPYVEELSGAQKIFLTGEGSSRIFPAKRAISENLKKGGSNFLFTEGATQALEYVLRDVPVFGMSNSGRTKELVRLFNKLRKDGHSAGLFGATAHESTPLQELTKRTEVLSCGGEDAVAATKSVAEQALIYQVLFSQMRGESIPELAEGADAVQAALEMSIDPSIIESLSKAETVYFAGRNDGVAEELTLKTNEITRKKSDYLEGTYAAHGIEEVMTDKDVLIIVDPFEEEEEKLKSCLGEGVGLNIVAISSRETMFPTVRIPESGDFAQYVQLAAGWNLLVEIGLALGIDLDKPVRARKVGNEV